VAFSGPELIYDGMRHRRKVPWSQNFKLLHVASSRLKRRGTEA